MVIWFNVEKAREFLLKNGFVFTLRPKRRREGREMLSYGGFGKKGMVNVKFVDWFIGEDRLEENLEQYVEFTGFDNVKEWLEEAKDSRILYKVSLIELVGENL